MCGWTDATTRNFFRRITTANMDFSIRGSAVFFAREKAILVMRCDCHIWRLSLKLAPCWCGSDALDFALFCLPLTMESD